MRQQRWWSAALAAWLCGICSLQLAASGDLVLGAVAGVVSLALLLVPPLHSVSVGAAAFAGFAALWGARASLGHLVGDVPASAFLFEGAGVAVAAVLAQRVGRGAADIERTAVHAMVGGLGDVVLPFDPAQAQAVREVRRARKYGREFSVMTVATIDCDTDAVDRLMARVQRENVQRYATARVGELLANETHCSDVISRRGDRFVLMLPETGSGGAERLARRLEEAAAKEIGVVLRIGHASFPEEEVTLDQLLERADAALAAADAEPDPEVNAAAGGAPRELAETP